MCELTELPKKIFCRPSKRGEEWWCKYEGHPKIGMVGCFFCENYEPCNLFVVVNSDNYPYSLSVIFPRMRLQGKTIEIGQDGLTEKKYSSGLITCVCKSSSQNKLCCCGSSEKNEKEYDKTFQTNMSEHTLYTVKYITPRRIWSTIDPELPRVNNNIWIDFPTTIEYIPLKPLVKSYI